MTYRGHVKDGLVIVDASVPLSDGLEVLVEILSASESSPLHPDLQRFTGILPADLDVRAEYARGIVEKHA